MRCAEEAAVCTDFRQIRNIVTSLRDYTSSVTALPCHLPPGEGFGASIVHILNNEEKVTTSVPGRQFYLYTRATLSPSDFLAICPAFVLMHRNKVSKVELNVQAFFNRMIWGGVTYRPDVGSGAWFSSNEVTFTIGMERNRLRFGYAFNLGLGEVAKLSKQSHEVLISYRIPKKKAKYQRFLEDEE